MSELAESPRTSRSPWSIIKLIFVRLGVLPFFLVAALVLFSVLEPRFFTPGNLFNMARQSTYLMIVALGQMIVLLTAGLDLSVGSTIALVSIITASSMGAMYAVDPNAVGLVIVVGIGAGLATGALVGAVNGIGVAVFNVSPFMMTLGMLSIAFGLALTISGGSPVYGLPQAFPDIFAYGKLFGIATPIYCAAGVFLAVYLLLTRTSTGRYFYALGSNLRAVHLSGIRVPAYLFSAYVLCGLLAGMAGVLLTARVQSGEANMGQELVLQSIAACVIGGVSLFGGIGRVGNVALGAIFITLLTNGMNLVRLDSYLQQVVIGAVLIFAIIVDQTRLKMAGQYRAG